MKKQAHITRKGQITVPHEIRRAMGIRPGDSLLFEQKGAEFHITAVRTEDRFGKFRGIDTPGITGGRKGIVRWLRQQRGR